MFQHILVPTDFSKQSNRAFDIAVNIARLGKGRITLLHVIETIADSTFEEFEPFYAKLENRAEKNMDKWIAGQQTDDVTVAKKILYGNRTEEIINFAQVHLVDLIVLNSHKINLEDPAKGWGTISYKVGILSSCPVMLVK